MCALALPVINIHISSPEEYKLLVEYAQAVGADLMILKKGIHVAPLGYERAPFRYRGMTVYLKRNSA